MMSRQGPEALAHVWPGAVNPSRVTAVLRRTPWPCLTHRKRWLARHLPVDEKWAGSAGPSALKIRGRNGQRSISAPNRM
jgi:hypothetical protein